MRYPFTPEILDALPEKLAELFRGLEDTLLQEICSRLNLKDQLNEVTIDDIKALRSLGISLEDIQKAITETTGISEQHLVELMQDVADRNQAYYSDLIDFAKVTKPSHILGAADVTALVRQTREELTNITRSMGFLVDNGRTMLQPAKAYQWALDSAALQIQSGAVSYQEAIKMAVRQLADSGIKTVDYESGHVDQVDVAVRRAVLTGVKQLCAQYTEASAEWLDTPYYEVSAHSGARDKPGPSPWSSHKDWQGKVYSVRTGDIYPNIYEVCGLGYVDGLEGANCRHIRSVWGEGVAERTYTDEQLVNIDNPPFEYEDNTYTQYEATQKQRQIERTVRKLKREKTAFEAVGLTDDARDVNIRIRRLRGKYREFSKAAGLREQPERMKVEYAGKQLISSAERDTIKSSIERGDTTGRPSAILQFGADLNNRQKELLENLPGADSSVILPKKKVSMKDLSALTAHTGVEYAMFTKNGQRLIVRGTANNVNIDEAAARELANSGYRWSGHTHPGVGPNVKTASSGDVRILSQFQNNRSAIYDSAGQFEVFEVIKGHEI